MSGRVQKLEQQVGICMGEQPRVETLGQKRYLVRGQDSSPEYVRAGQWAGTFKHWLGMTGRWAHPRHGPPRGLSRGLSLRVVASPLRDDTWVI